MAKDKTKKSGARSIVVDEEMIEAMKNSGGGGSVRVPEDDYPARLVKIERTLVKSGDNEGKPMLVLHYKIKSGKHKGKVIKDRIAIIASTMWKLRQLYEAIGKKVPTKAFKIDLDGLEGSDVAITVVDGEPYRNKIKSEISDVQPIDSLEEDDDDDDDDEDDDDLEEVDVDDEL